MADTGEKIRAFALQGERHSDTHRSQELFLGKPDLQSISIKPISGMNVKKAYTNVHNTNVLIYATVITQIVGAGYLSYDALIFQPLKEDF